jgi:ABC-type transport system substrate-binding protein
MKKKSATFCFFNPWRNLNPGLQNTLVGSIIIPQQFQSLVSLDDEGNIAPLLAESWEVDNKFTKIHFKLKRDLKFSNGDEVNSIDVINAWYESLRKGSEQPNNSLWDVFYKIEGAENFKLSGNIPGIKILNSKEIEINFKNPFRLALHKFSDSRFAIYKNINGTNIGTGKFVYDDKYVDTNQIELISHQIDFNLKYQYIKDYNELKELQTCDLFYIPDGGNLIELNPSDKLSVLELENSFHSILVLNSLDGVFSKKENRRAFQALLQMHKSKIENVIQNKTFSRFDMQLFNNFSSGRLDESESDAIIKRDEIFIPSFLAAIKKNKLIIANDKDNRLKKAFSIMGLSELIEFVKFEKTETAKQINTGKMKADVYFGGFSTISYDPDGVYHALGKNGAILYPATSNEKMFEVLEEGRKLTDFTQIDDHYKKVSRVFLEEVPLVHLGFMSSLLVYRNDRISIDGKVARNHLDFSILNKI